MTWHANGNQLAGGLNRFLNYWASIELLAHFFYEYLPLEKTSRDQKKATIMGLLADVTESNCLERVAGCTQELQTSIRTKLFKVLPAVSAGKISADGLFDVEKESGKSLYDIRNDIAHGSFCDHEIEFTDVVEKRIHSVQAASREVLYAVLNNASEISRKMEAA
jgi:hypothetical protein